MCIHRLNMHTLRESILHLRDAGCGHLKVTPISDVGAWHQNGHKSSEPLSFEELFRLYLDYIPSYYEDGMPLAVQLGGFFSADPQSPDKYDLPMYKYPEDPATCLLFKEGWALKLIRKMNEICPEATSPASSDKELMKHLETQTTITT